MSSTTEQTFEHAMSGLKDGVATATASVEQAQTNMRDGMQRAMKTAEEMFAFSQGNFDAFARSSQIFVIGLQEIGQTFAAAARASFDETMSTMKAMGAAHSIKEALDLQAGLVRSAVEKAVSQTSQITDSSLKLSEQTFAPIGARLSLAAEKFGRVG